MSRRVVWLVVLLLSGVAGAEEVRQVVEAKGGRGRTNSGLFEVPEDREAIVEEYVSTPPPGVDLPKRWTSAFWIERRNHVLLKADPTGENGTVLAPGHYRLIADGGPGAYSRLVLRIGPRVHVITQPTVVPARNLRDEWGYQAPAVRAFTIVPMGSATFPETRGLAETLERRFPGISFRIAPRRDLPKEVLDERGVVRPAVLAALLPARSGHLALVDRPVPLPESWEEYPHGSLDPSTATGVVTVWDYRRWAAGDSKKVDAWTRNEVTAIVGAMLGMSWPCRRLVCGLRPVRGEEGHDQIHGDLCERHQRELEAIRKQR